MKVELFFDQTNTFVTNITPKCTSLINPRFILVFFHANKHFDIFLITKKIQD